jgi:2-C-methyl-D-erythritol 4-phosphate cytidylyltransferase
VPLAGKPMIEWSLDAFRACESVRAIVVAIPPESDQAFADQTDLGVVWGGASRAQSVANCLDSVSTDMVAIHDAARPLLEPELIEALVCTLEEVPEAAGVIAATPVTDTVKQAADRRSYGETSDALYSYGMQSAALAIERTVDRGRLWAAQTPQLFRTAALRKALAVEPARRDAATDEAMLVEEAGGTVLLHRSGPENFKVTTPHDLRVAEALLAGRDGA